MPSNPAAWDEARRWFAIAAQDIATAQLCLNHTEPLVGPAAYHVQQAAEKLIKGLLVAAGTSFRKTHDLDELAEQAALHYPKLGDHLDACRPLTIWSTIYRYPGLDDDLGPISSEVAEALTRLSNFRQAIERLTPP